jgi:hypothetical protein
MPPKQLTAGVVVEHVDIQFTLFGEACERQVAAAQETDSRVVGIGAMSQVQLGMERMPKEQLDDDLVHCTNIAPLLHLKQHLFAMPKAAPSDGQGLVSAT